MKNKYFKILFWISVFLFIIDYILTVSSPYYEIIEANILYNITGGLIAVIIFNIIFLFVCYIIYHISKIEYMKVIVINSLIILNFMRSIAIENNIGITTSKVPKEVLTAVIKNNPQLIIQTNITLYTMIITLAIVSLLTFTIWFEDKQNI